MKRSLLMLAIVVGVVAASSGVALAATIQCPNRPDGGCWGTTEDDTITGTPQEDGITARNGDDVVNAGGDEDLAIGGGGEDSVYGQAGPDFVIGGNVTGLNSDDGNLYFADSQDDIVRGGVGADDPVAGGYGRGGQDKLYGGEGDDTVYAAQRGFPFDGDVRVNKEIVDCGPGEDTAYYDRGVDVVEGNCETRINGFPDMEERSGTGAGRVFGAAPR